ncbi:excisionase family DNA-binding protein [Rhodobacterales bacterium HKCCSP123]|nr:excisionase family DNA-binding protein [Rhodobacterales bacterium HKCCSP123]
MARRYPVRLIKTHRIYTVWEVADLLNCHRQTVIRWIKNEGLEADQTHRPWLIRGSDLKSFLGHRQSKRRCQLGPATLYCLGCRCPQEPAGRMADYVQQTSTTGMFSALCPACGSIMNKVIKRADLDFIRATVDVTVQQASPRLVSLKDAPSHVTLKQERQTNGKAQ